MYVCRTHALADSRIRQPGLGVSDRREHERAARHDALVDRRRRRSGSQRRQPAGRLPHQLLLRRERDRRQQQRHHPRRLDARAYCRLGHLQRPNPRRRHVGNDRPGDVGQRHAGPLREQYLYRRHRRQRRPIAARFLPARRIRKQYPPRRQRPGPGRRHPRPQGQPGRNVRPERGDIDAQHRRERHRAERQRRFQPEPDPAALAVDAPLPWRSPREPIPPLPWEIPGRRPPEHSC